MKFNSIYHCSYFKLLRFSFTVPEALREHSEGPAFSPILRRSRSNPIGLEDSDDEDIEVPRFQSLDHQDLDEDSDGDLDLPRRGDTTEEKELVIEHKIETQLKDVGLQVWRGSLLLADFLLDNHEDFNNKQVLEVGSGTGLSSIVASFCGARY